MGIPKVIHYCWFGKNPLPKSFSKYVKSWKRYCPDYEIVQWNEDNFDVNCNIFCKRMYDEKRWAFVSDYARLKIIYEHGGIYLDTDVELVKSLDELLENKAFMGFQDSKEVANGLGFGAEKRHPFIKENMKYYECLEEGIEPVACPHITTKLLKEYGLNDNNGEIQTVAGVTIYPIEYFCPKSERTGLIEKTSRTFSIHHFDASWFNEEWKRGQKKRWKRAKIDYIVHIPNRVMRKAIGNDTYEKLKKMCGR